MPNTIDSATSAGVRDCPYQELDYFGTERNPWFFGREIEQRRLIAQVRTSKLTVLYAESGVGKSSLLRAGVAARLLQLADAEDGPQGSGRLLPIVFSDWKNDPVRDFRNTLAVQGGRLAASRAERLELPGTRTVEALRGAASALDATLLIILDQFEEHLGRVRAHSADHAFLDQLNESLLDGEVNASFLIGVREDAYGKVDELFRRRIAGERSNMHLGYLTREAAHAAITRPVDGVYNAGRPPEEHVVFGDGLVDEVLRQVPHGNDPFRLARSDRASASGAAANDDEIEAPFLQLVMTRLWEREVDENHFHELRLETFVDSLGGATTIVRRHLEQALKTLSDVELEIATGVFRELVTTSGTKLALSARDLAGNIEHDEAAVDAVLETLDRSRIVRSVDAGPDASTGRYEIFHDRFTEPILELLNIQKQTRLELAKIGAETAQKQAEKQAKREVRQKQVSLVFAAVCLVFAVVALVEFVNAHSAQNAARRSATEAAEASLKSLAQADLATRPDIALLLLLAAHSRTSPSIDARNIAALLQSTRSSGTSGILHGHSDVVESVAFSPTADVLASGSADGTVRLWHVTETSRQPLRHVLHAGGDVFGVAFSPNGQQLAVATFDKVELWDVTRAAQIDQFSYKPGTLITSVAFQPRRLDRRNGDS